MNTFSLLLLLLFVCVIVLCVFFIYNKYILEADEIEPFTANSVEEYLPRLEEKRKERPFPFRFMQNKDGKLLPIVFVSAPFRDDNAKELYLEFVRNGVVIIGITAYKSFPKLIRDNTEGDYHLKDDFDYVKNIKNWLCCFNNPKQYGLDPEVNNIIDMSESDFYDIDMSNTPKKYDILYSCPDEDESKSCNKNGWNAINRNFDLFLRCLPILVYEYKLKICIVGRSGCGLEEKYGSHIERNDFLNYFEFQDKMKQSRFLIIPNIYDASPRVVTEAISKGLLVLMNRTILCGSKYITHDTGELFTDEHDIRYALDRLLEKEHSVNPREWWTKNYGKSHSAKRLRDFIVKCYPGKFDNEIEMSMFV